jgi:hypothetical protein
VDDRLFDLPLDPIRPHLHRAGLDPDDVVARSWDCGVGFEVELRSGECVRLSDGTLAAAGWEIGRALDQLRVAVLRAIPRFVRRRF